MVSVAAPDDGLHEVGLHVAVHVPGGRQARVHHVVAAAPHVVAVAVALLAVSINIVMLLFYF